MEKANKPSTDVSELVKLGVKELIIREGNALPVHHLNNVEISGTISAPGRFIKERHEDFENNTCYALVSRENKSIVLNLHERSAVGNYTITGKIKVGSKFTKLGINSDEGLNPMQLSKLLKMHRSLFKSPADHALVVNSLKNIQAKLKQDIDAKDDSRGNVSVSFNQVLESNIPKEFTLVLPLLEGEPPTEFLVHVFIEGRDYNGLTCFLESVDAADLIEAAVDKRIDEEIKIIEEHAVIIES